MAVGQGKTLEQLAAEGWHPTPELSKPEAHMSAAVPGSAMPADMKFSAFGTALQGGPQGSVEQWMHTPLAHPSGVEAIDSQTSPANLALLALTGGKALAQSAIGKIAALVHAAEPDVATEILGMLSPRVAHGVRAAQKVMQAASAAAPEATSPVEAAAAAPAPAAPVAPPASGAAPVPSVRPPTPGPEMPAAPATPPPSPAVAVVKGETLALPATQRTAGQMSDAWLANDVGVAAKRAQVPLTPKQLQEAVQLVRKSGKSPLEIVQAIQGDVPPPAAPMATPKPKLSAPEMATVTKLMQQGKTPKQAFDAIAAMRQLGQGLPSTGVVDATVNVRNATGRWPK